MRAPRSRRASLDTLIDELLSLQSLLLSEARAAGEWGVPCSPAFHFHCELCSNIHADTHTRMLLQHTTDEDAVLAGPTAARRR